MNKDNIGKFVGSVLLSTNIWDKKKLIADLKDEWHIEILNEEVIDDSGDAIVTTIYGYKVVIIKSPFAVPYEEAEKNAANNYMWREAVEVTKSHKAHIVVSVLGDREGVIESGLIYTEIIASCCRQENAIGVFTSGVVFEPSYYIESAEMIKDHNLPIFNWIWFGLYPTDKGLSAYTYGMAMFGKNEIEVLNTAETPRNLIEFISGIVSYVLESDVTLRDGETIGFFENDKHRITLSAGVALPEQDTLKIAYTEGD